MRIHAPERGAVCCSRPSIRVTAGIVWRIGLRFNNPSAQTGMPKIADKSFADQKSRELDGAGGQLCPEQREGRRTFNAIIMEASVLSHLARSIVFNGLPIQRSGLPRKELDEYGWRRARLYTAIWRS